MLYPATILIFAAVASAIVTVEIKAPLMFFAMLTLYFAIVIWVALEIFPRLRRDIARARRLARERRELERSIYRALWEQGRF